MDTTEIVDYLNEYFEFIDHYSILDNGVINVIDGVSLKDEPFNLDHMYETGLKIQFGHIKGHFQFDNSTIETIKGFPYLIESYCSIDNCKKLKSLEYAPKCLSFYCNQCISLESLDGLNCERFIGNDLKLKKIGTNFTARWFKFNNFPTPTADEMRRFIQLNPELFTNQREPWITLINDYFNHKDMFRAICEFEALYCKNVLSVYSTHYNEPWVKPEDKIEISQSSEISLSI